MVIRVRQNIEIRDSTGAIIQKVLVMDQIR